MQRVILNGREMNFVEGGYKYIFMKPYEKHQHRVIKRDNGELTLQLYDNGVQIRTLVTPEEAATVINREIAIDYVNHKVYILEPDSKVTENEDGTVTIEE